MVVQKLDKKTVSIFTNTLAYHINTSGDQVKEVQCIDLITNEKLSFHAKVCILSAGALATPQLILNSELEKVNPAGHVIGRYLMRHSNAIVFGIFPGVADKENRFHKELAILDFYFGHESIDYPKYKLGSLQQVPTPPSGLVENEAPFPLGIIAGKAVKLLTGLLAIAEDQPQYKNYIKIDKSQGSINHIAKTLIAHEYTDRDTAAINALIAQGKKIMSRTGALINYVHHIRTFSHAVGTVRMGVDPNTSALDKNCNFRGLDNLYVVDASFMPTSAAVNPSLTISANALRVADHLINKFPKS
jgi:choline dehydrogenase-like flavoprotein